LSSHTSPDEPDRRNVSLDRCSPAMRGRRRLARLGDARRRRTSARRAVYTAAKRSNQREGTYAHTTSSPGGRLRANAIKNLL
jgi:hypothetical protein